MLTGFGAVEQARRSRRGGRVHPRRRLRVGIGVTDSGMTEAQKSLLAVLAVVVGAAVVAVNYGK